MKKVRVLFNIFLLTSLLSCNTTWQELPPADQMGWYTVGCFVNDVLWGVKKDMLLTGFYQFPFSYTGGVLNFTAKGATIDDLPSTLTFHLPHLLQPGTYSLTNNHNDSLTRAVIGLSIADGYKTYISHPDFPGKVIITGIDTTSSSVRYISGTFEGTLTNFDDTTDVLYITKGRFDLPL